MRHTGRTLNPMDMPMKPALLVALLCATPAMADDPLTLTIKNTSSRAVAGFSVYPVDTKTGLVVDDNMGGIVDPIAPGASHVLQLSLIKCDVVEMWARFADGEEVSGRTDLCRNRTILLHD